MSGLFASVVVFCLATAYGLWYLRVRRRAQVLSPGMLFLLFLSVFVLPLPVRALITTEVEGNITNDLSELLPYLPEAVLLCAIGIPLFLHAYGSRAASKVALRLPAPAGGDQSLVAFVILFGVCLYLLGELAKETGGLLAFILLGYDSTEQMFGRGHLAVGFPWLFVASLFLLQRYVARKTKQRLFWFAVVFGLVVGIHLLLGSRTMILYMSLTVAIFWHQVVRPIKGRILVLSGLVAFLCLNAYGYLRGSDYDSVSDVWTRTQSAYSEAPSLNHTLFYTLTSGEFVVPFETLPQVIRADLQPQWGMTYLRAPLFWIPTVLYPDRPPSLTTWYMETFYGDGFGLNQGRAFFFLAEGYLNFGVLGVLATMALWGLGLGVVHNYGEHSRGLPGATLLYALTVAFIYRGIAGDFTSVFVGLPQQSLSAAVLGLWISNRHSQTIYKPGRFRIPKHADAH